MRTAKRNASVRIMQIVTMRMVNADADPDGRGQRAPTLVQMDTMVLVARNPANATTVEPAVPSMDCVGARKDGRGPNAKNVSLSLHIEIKLVVPNGNA